MLDEIETDAIELPELPTTEETIDLTELSGMIVAVVKTAVVKVVLDAGAEAMSGGEAGKVEEVTTAEDEDVAGEAFAVVVIAATELPLALAASRDEALVFAAVERNSVQVGMVLGNSWNMNGGSRQSCTTPLISSYFTFLFPPERSRMYILTLINSPITIRKDEPRNWEMS